MNAQKTIQHSTSPYDPVEQLGRDLGEVLRATDRLEDAHAAAEDPNTRSFLDVRLKHLLWRQSQLEAAFPAHNATTVGGALVAVVRAAALADLIRSEMPAIEDDELGKVIHRDFCDLRAVLYSALDALRAAAPGVYEACEGQYYMRDNHSPFNAIEEANTVLPEVSSAA